jgi:hypothetical protein
LQYLTGLIRVACRYIIGLRAEASADHGPFEPAAFVTLEPHAIADTDVREAFEALFAVMTVLRVSAKFLDQLADTEAHRRRTDSIVVLDQRGDLAVNLWHFRCGNLRPGDLLGHVIEKEQDWHVENRRNLKQPTGAHAVRALFVFLNLLERDANRFAKVVLANSLQMSCEIEATADMLIYRVRHVETAPPPEPVQEAEFYG